MSNDKKIKVLFAAFEVNPFVKTGGLADVAGALPNSLVKEGIDCRVIMPLLSSIPYKYRKNMIKITECYVPLGWRHQYMGLYSLFYNHVTYYFIDNEYYFKRDNAYGYFDDGERIGYFSKAILEALVYMDFAPDILHLNDWHDALSSVYLREMYRGIEKFNHIKTLTTIHNIKFQGMYSKFVLDDVIGLGYYPDARRQLMQGDAVNFMRGGLNYTDYITTVSPSYAEEIKSPYYGEKLEDIFLRRSDIVKGILNGIDYDRYNPKTDPHIYVNYDINNLQNKYKNKTELQKELGLNVDYDLPMFCIVSRLTEQKGIDLITAIFEELMDKSQSQFVILGVGDKKYVDAFKYFENKYRGRVSSNQFFSEELSRKIYAGSDMILIPSRFEPCGLTQMIAMRYLTLPIVRETGGLKDSVVPYNQYTKEGNGFSFSNFNAHELLYTIQHALDLYYNDRETFNLLIKHASETNFSWTKSAKEYIKIYEHLMSY